MNLETILNNYPNEEFLLADGFNDAILGVDETEMRLIYSVSRCLDILMKNMSHEEAEEYFEFNVSGAYMGEKRLFGAMIKF
jgi:hypothetical protein